MLRHFVTLLGVAAFLAFAVGPAWAVPYTPYYITELGTLGGTGTTVAKSINNLGQIVGESRDSNEQRRCFHWSNGTMENLGALSCEADYYYAEDINDVGAAIGFVFTDNAEVFPYLWNSGTMTYLFGGTATEASVCAINNSGAVVGATPSSGYNTDAMLYSNGSLTNLGTLIGYYSSHATAINNAGFVGGEGYFDDSVIVYEPFLYDSSTGSTTMLNTVISGAQKVVAINDNGWIVGEGDKNSFNSETFLWNGTTSCDVGMFADGRRSYASDINNHGQVVGQSIGAYDPEGITRAYLFDGESSQLLDLHDLLGPSDQAEWSVLYNATSINDSGQIVGYGATTDSNSARGFLMTPALPGDANIDGSVNGTDLNAVLSNYNQTFSGDNKTRWMAGDFNVDGSVNGTDLNTVLSNYNQSVSFSSTAAVPEPSTMLLMFLGLIGLWASRKRWMV